MPTHIGLAHLRLGHVEQQFVCPRNPLFPLAGVHHQHEVLLTAPERHDSGVAVPGTYSILILIHKLYIQKKKNYKSKLNIEKTKHRFFLFEILIKYIQLNERHDRGIAVPVAYNCFVSEL